MFEIISSANSLKVEPIFQKCSPVSLACGAENLLMSFPVIIWTRIITSLKPTLALKIQNEERNAYFFYST